MSRLLETIAGLFALAGLIIRARGGLSGRYWTWRQETAFGSCPTTGRSKIRAALEYARWLHRMRKLERQRRR